MKEKFNKNAKVEQLTKMLGRVSAKFLYFLLNFEELLFMGSYHGL